MNTKNIDILQLAVEGFRSYVKSTIVDLDGKGLTLVKGTNGAGKTSIFSALSWCLFRVNLNGTVNDKVQSFERLRDKDYRGTRVATMLEVIGGQYAGCYLIARHLNFTGKTKGIKGGSGLFIFRRDNDFNFTDADLLSDAQHKSDQQEYIHKILGVDSKMFLNSVLFGQRMPRLVSTDNKDKRELFETMFDLDFVEIAKTKAKNKKIEITTELAILTTKVDGSAKQIEEAETHYNSQKVLMDNWDKEQKDRIQEVKDEIAEVVEELEELDAKLVKDKDIIKTAGDEAKLKVIKDTYDNSKTAVSDLKDEVSELERNVTATDREINTSKQTRSKYEQQLTEIKTKCTVCGKPLDAKQLTEAKNSIKSLIKKEDEVIATLESTKIKTQTTIKAKNTLLTKANAKLVKDKKAFDDSKDAMDSLATAKTDLKLTEQSIQTKEAEVTKLKTRLQKEKDAKAPEINLKELADQIELKKKEALGNTAAQLTKTTYLNRVNWWIDKAFSASGLKSYVFSAMLTQLNQNIEKYAARLGYGCKFMVDMSKASKPFVTTCYKQGYEVDYLELSGGQQQMLDVIISFGMHDVVTDSMSDFNILILDEIFEGLAPVNIEAVFDLIRLKADSGRHVYVITHSPTIDSLGSKTLTVDYVDEISYLD